MNVNNQVNIHNESTEERIAKLKVSIERYQSEVDNYESGRVIGNGTIDKDHAKKVYESNKNQLAQAKKELKKLKAKNK